MANNNTNKNPASIQPNKPGWIRACFGLGSSHKTRAVTDRPAIDDTSTAGGGGGRRRRIGSGILRAVKRPWCKNKDKTTSLKIKAEKVVGGSTASKVAAVAVGSQKSLLLFLDGESHQAQGPIGGPIEEEFDIAKDTNSSTCLNQSRSIKESNSGPHKTKLKVINKPIPEEHSKLLKEEPSSVRFLSKQSRSNSTKRSSKDPFIGMSIIIIILVIMLLCGRICAILCTSVWFYCTPQLNKTITTKSNKLNTNNSSVKSEIERKKVVLMGFLERKQGIFC